MICTTTTLHNCKDMNWAIRARFTAVENAITFFTSINDTLSLITIIPTQLNTANMVGIDHNEARYIPATTIVEECSREDTGVGLSIAIGNQYDLNQVALLAIIATKNHKGLEILSNINISTRSPKRLYITAETEAETAWERPQ